MGTHFSRRSLHVEPLDLHIHASNVSTYCSKDGMSQHFLTLRRLALELLQFKLNAKNYMRLFISVKNKSNCVNVKVTGDKFDLSNLT